jgi:RHS repeat-associated protein
VVTYNTEPCPTCSRRAFKYRRERGVTYYELSNHLGNVLVTVTDMKVGISTDGDDFAEYYEATVVSAVDYYLFGSAMAGRKYNQGTYRYGFNGMEKDDEVKGEGNSYTTHYRLLDVRIGRWLSTDPLKAHFPYQSPYISVDNKPIIRADKNGDCPQCAAAVAGAVVGALLDMVIQVGEHMVNGDDMSTAISKIDYLSVGKEAGVGAMAGVSGYGAAAYMKKAAAVLKSPAGRAATVFLAEQAVDFAVSMAASWGYEASGLEAAAYGALGYQQMSNKAVGAVGELETKKQLDNLYKQKGHTIVAEVTGEFADGTKTRFDFVVLDKKSNIIEAVESKANTAGYTKQQRRYWNKKESVSISKEVLEEAGAPIAKAQKVNANTTRSITYRWKVNRYTGSSTLKYAKNIFSKIKAKP